MCKVVMLRLIIILLNIYTKFYLGIEIHYFFAQSWSQSL